MELARLKRRYLAEGFTEAEIHKVIPDRPRSKPAKAADPAKKQPSAECDSEHPRGWSVASARFSPLGSPGAAFHPGVRCMKRT
jgi:hypothetical protein